MACPKCNHEINLDNFPLGLIFCPYCGEKISDQAAFQVIPFCRCCGHRLLTDVTFCPECGKRTAPEAPPIPAGAGETVLVLSGEPEEPAEEGDLPSDSPAESPEQPARPVWPRVKAVFTRVYQPVEGVLTGRWRLKKLYKDWSAHDALPPDEIPPDDTLKKVAQATAPPVRRRVPLWMMLLAGAGILLFFVAIGIVIKLSA